MQSVSESSQVDGGVRPSSSPACVWRLSDVFPCGEVDFNRRYLKGVDPLPVSRRKARKVFYKKAFTFAIALKLRTAYYDILCEAMLAVHRGLFWLHDVTLRVEESHQPMSNPSADVAAYAALLSLPPKETGRWLQRCSQWLKCMIYVCPWEIFADLEPASYGHKYTTCKNLSTSQYSHAEEQTTPDTQNRPRKC